MKLLLESGLLDYDTLIVCGNSLHQSEYNVLNKMITNGFSKGQIACAFNNQDRLRKEFSGIDEFIGNEKGKGKGGINGCFLDDVADIPDPRDHDSKRKNLLVLDDIMLGPQNKAEAYYTRGRHNNVDTIYIAQNYFRLPRQTVRENANLFMLFRQDAKNLRHIYQDHCTEIPFDEFAKFCMDVWSADKHNFVTINVDTDDPSRKYRCKLDEFWTPPSENVDSLMSRYRVNEFLLPFQNDKSDDSSDEECSDVVFNKDYGKTKRKRDDYVINNIHDQKKNKNIKTFNPLCESQMFLNSTKTFNPLRGMPVKYL